LSFKFAVLRAALLFAVVELAAKGNQAGVLAFDLSLSSVKADISNRCGGAGAFGKVVQFLEL